jgi:PAS domain-containing protein
MTPDFGNDDLMTILEGVNDGVIKLDRGANYVALNRAASEIFRQLGRDPVRVLKEGLPTKHEFYLPPAKRWYETSAYPSKEGVILVIRDITQSKVNEPSENEGE